MRKTTKAASAVKILLLIFLAVTVLCPLVSMLFTIAEVDIWAVLSSKMFLQSTLNSFVVTLTATVFSIVLAMLLAWCVARSKVKHKNMLAVLLTVPMLIPSISHGMGLVILLGSNGILTNLLHLPFDIYGFWGIVIGSILYSFPVAFLMLLDIFQYEDYAPYESAQVLGICLHYSSLSAQAHDLHILCYLYSDFYGLRRPIDGGRKISDPADVYV